VYAHVHDEPPAVAWEALGAPPEIDAVLRRALAKDPAARYPSAGDLGRAAMAACEGRAPSVGERTVAAGAAAPGATQVSPVWPATQTGATRPLTWPPPPGQAAPPPASPPPERRNATPFIVLAAVLVLAGAGMAVAAASGVFSKGGGAHTVVHQVTAPPSGPAVSVRNVRDLLSAYAKAYSNEDSGSLARLFASDLVRRASSKPKMDKPQALAEYDRQFARLSDPTYSLSNVRITTGGGAATANADYAIRDADGAPATGTIEFRMRVHGNLLLIDALDIRSR
jgi:serine/threonine-protein kinase